MPQTTVFTDFPTMDDRPQHLAMTHIRIASDPTRKEIDVTYYRVDFAAAKLISRPAKRFRTEEKAKKHARRVLGVADDGDLGTRVAIVAVSRTELQSGPAPKVRRHW